ncbi:MAG: ribosome-associated translation inhibitor RaiA [Candidatus Liptonbacteria bacterium]|nr:ribosome-associated translation inhibitor RaiA [Candidatus Liptonbacteria bacterium]
MRITVKATKLVLTPALNVFIEKRLARLSKLLKSWDDRGSVLLRVEVARTTRHHKKGDVFRAEVNLDMPSKVLRAEAENNDIRIAVNEAYKKLEGEVKKIKGKLESKKR